MAPMSRGRVGKPAQIVKPRLKKKESVTNQNHRFESFSNRIGKLNIDPVRKANHQVVPLDRDESHFRMGLDEWRDLNMSANFVAFAEEVDPLSENLPQIIYHQDQIMNLLISYLDKQDELSLQPFLNLIAHFAHDLGSRFERHFQKTIDAIATLASSHSSLEVIEWSFNCFAWLFKYLSRLLVSDLRPLYDLMSPLLGRRKQRPFITRFAAEAMSFLVRKAGAIPGSNRAPLDGVVRYCFDDLLDNPTDSPLLLQQGIGLMFADSIKGVQHSVNSNGKPIFEALLSLYSTYESVDPEQDARLTSCIQSICVKIIHHTDANGFRCVQDSILEHLNRPIGHEQRSSRGRQIHILFIMLGTRKATRITDWPLTLDTLSNLICSNSTSKSDHDLRSERTLTDATAVALKYCPFDLAITFSQKVLPYLQEGRWERRFPQFCAFVCELGHERFATLVQGNFQKFMAVKTPTSEICYLLPRLSAQVLEASNSHLSIPQVLENFIKHQVMDAKDSLSCGNGASTSARLLNRYFDLPASIFSVRARHDICVSLSELLRLTSEAEITETTRPIVGLTLSKGLRFVSQFDNSSIIEERILDFVLMASTMYARSEPYLEAILNFTSAGLVRTNSRPELDLLVEKLIANIRDESQILRYHSLSILDQIFRNPESPFQRPLAMSLKVENTDFNVQNARVISMHIRTLPSIYGEWKSDRRIAEILISHCFGLLQIHLAPIWEDVLAALNHMLDTKDSESYAINIVKDWLLRAPEKPLGSGQVKDTVAPDFTTRDELQCSNLNNLIRISNRIDCELENCHERLTSLLERDTTPITLGSGLQRLQALRVLKQAPELAEKKSKVLVPLFLEWFSTEAGHLQHDDDFNSEDETTGSSPTLTCSRESSATTQEKKSLLTVFAQFNNPRAIYQSQEVHSVLLKILCSGDAEIQRLASKSLFAWKNPHIRPYEGALLNLLDDVRFREELTTVFDLDQDEIAIKEEDTDELMPILLRILYGRMISKSGPRGSAGQRARRAAALVALHKFSEKALSAFLDLALAPLDEINLFHCKSFELNEATLQKHAGLPMRNQLGMLKMMSTVLEVLGNAAAPFVPKILNVILFSVIQTSRTLSRNDPIDKSLPPWSHVTSLDKSVRLEGLHCLILLVRSCPNQDWTPYAGVLIREIICPKLDSLPLENSQSVSILLRLLATFSQTGTFLTIFSFSDCAVVHRLGACVGNAATKEEVKSFVLTEIIEHVLNFAMAGMDRDRKNHEIILDVEKRLRLGLAFELLGFTSMVLEKAESKDCIEACVSTTMRLAHFIQNEEEMKVMTEVSLRLLTQPPKRISPLLKSELLHLLQTILPKCVFDPSEPFFRSALRTLTSLFSYFKDGPNRVLLARVFEQLTSRDSKMHECAALCSDLNSFRTSRLNEPDFDRRLAAFGLITERGYLNFSPQQWGPLLHNLIFLMHDEEEISMRTSSSLGLKRFVEAASSLKHDEQMKLLVNEVLLPQLQKGLRNPSELIRAEFVVILGDLVKCQWPRLEDMQVLLQADEESSFFHNVLQIQEHRRTRALRRLAYECDKISADNISRLLLPFVEAFLIDADSAPQNIVAESVKTLEALVKGLEWHQFRARLQRLVNEKTRFDSKIGLRILAAVVNGFFRAYQDSQRDGRPLDNRTQSYTVSNLQRTLPETAKMTAYLSDNVLPTLLEFAHFKDESTVDYRINVAVTAVKIIMTLHEDEIAIRLPPLLMDICNILKSKAQEARDAARKTLAEIAAIIGPRYFGFMLKQLRSVLQRGAHLHILAYTVHSLLVSAAPKLRVGDIDHCLDSLVTIFMDDVFGTPGKEKEATEYTSQMREVRKKSLSYDSMELVASITSIPCVLDLTSPIREYLERPRPRLEKVDEMLRRVREGVRKNKTAEDRKSLVLCYRILKDSLKTEDGTDLRSPSTYKVASFALGLCRRVLDKHESLKTVENLSGFMPTINIAMRQREDELQVSSMRLLTAIIKVPLEDIDANAGDYVKLVRRIIETEPSTNTALCQAALRLVSALLRERPQAIIKQSQFEHHIALLLERIRPDLQEPSRSGERDRQVAAFNFLRAVIGRGVLMKEIYDVMDTVREVMITTQEHPIPALSRSVYSRFVLDYFPEEGKGLVKQVEYLISNLQYPHAHGRQSAMDVMGFLLGKKSNAAVQSLCVDLFLPLVLVLVTDSTEDCRSAARILLHKIFVRADSERTKAFRSQLQKWIDSNTDEVWKRVGFQCWEIYFEVHQDASREAPYVVRRTRSAIEALDETIRWEEVPLATDAMRLYGKLCDLFPFQSLSQDSTSLWEAVLKIGQSAHQPAKMESARLSTFHLKIFAKSLSNTQKSSFPLKIPTGLNLSRDGIGNIIEAHNSVLRSSFDQSLIDQATQNLALAGLLTTSAESRDILYTLLETLCATIRLDTPDHSQRSKSATLNLLNTLCKLSPTMLPGSTLHDILLTLNNITDTAITTASDMEKDESEAHEQVVNQAHELLGLLQEKLGTETFIAELQTVQQEVRERREERRTKRHIEAVSAPEKAEARKHRKHDASKTKRREKNAKAAGMRRGW